MTSPTTRAHFRYGRAFKRPLRCFFFQAEDGIRDLTVTGVQTCALPILGMRTIRIGAGAGYSGDRIEPAVDLAERGKLDYLVFECLAERTIALAQQADRKSVV